MNISVSYAGLIERQDKIAFYEHEGYRMLNDTFDVGWKPGEPPFGYMIFTDTPSIPDPIIHRDLPTEIDLIASSQLAHHDRSLDPLDPDYISASLILSNPPPAMPMPQIWELLRYFGRLHGINL